MTSTHSLVLYEPREASEEVRLRFGRVIAAAIGLLLVAGMSGSERAVLPIAARESGNAVAHAPAMTEASLAVVDDAGHVRLTTHASALDDPVRALLGARR